MAAEADSAAGTAVDVPENSTKRPVQNAKRNVKFLLSRPATVRFTVKNALPSAKMADADSSGAAGFLLIIKLCTTISNNFKRTKRPA